MKDELVGEGAARELLSALHNLHALLRSPRVGPKVVEPLLPEIRKRVTRLASASVTAVSVYDTALLPTAVRAWEARLVGALDAAARQRVDARTRLALEGAVAEIAPRIDALREALDVRVRAEAKCPALELLLGSLVLETLAAPASTRPFGDALSVRALGDEAAALAVLAAPQTTLSVLAFALSFAARGTQTVGVEVRAEGDRVLLLARPTSAPPTHSFVAPLATEEAEVLLFAPAGLLTRLPDEPDAVAFVLPRGHGDFGVPSPG